MQLHLVNHITGLDFAPNGETMATMDYYGTCLISDVNTDKHRFHINMEMENDFSKHRFFNIYDIQRLCSNLTSLNNY